MKKALFSFFALLFASIVSAQTFRPFTELRVIKTEKFDIVFPERSRRTAEALSRFADRTYERVSSLLDIRVPGRIPVTVTPDSDAYNGYSNPVPYPHIVLYDAPMDPEWTTFADALEGLFIHELTHIVSLSARSSASDVLYRIFGGWAMPTYLTAPLFMVEGVTVSFESLDGFGRANDPLVKERVAQAAEDGAFLTPFQASGVYDKPPYGNAYYEYGGLFSAYLQKRWGMESYARLWHEMGSRLPLSLRYYRHGFYRLFRDVYGEDFLDVWYEFADSLRVAGLEDNAPNSLLDGERSFDTVRSGGGRAFFADTVAGGVFAYDPSSARTERVAKIDGTVSDIDVTSDGRLLLVASYRSRGALYDAVVTEFDVASGRKTGRRWNGLRKPRFFRDGVVGIAATGLANRLVFRDGSDRETVVLSGDAERVYSSPAPIDGDRIAFIVAERGIRSLGVYDFGKRTAYRLGTGGEGDAERFRYVRDLRAQNGKLYFSYAEKDGFYKLGAVDETGFILSGRSFSGGVFAPVEIAGALYYRAAFSTWDALARYPEAAASLSGERLPLVAESVPAASEEASASPGPSPASVETGYFAPSYLNPLRFWIPYPLVRTDGETVRVDGGGFLSYMADPTDTDIFLLQGGYDAFASAPFASLEWVSYGLGIPFSMSVSDGLEFNSAAPLNDAYRATRASASIGLSRGIAGERVSYALSASASGLLYANDPGTGESAYAWNYSPAIYAIGVSAEVSSLQRPRWRLFGTGADMTASAYYRLPEGDVRVESVLKAAFEPTLPLRLTVYGVYDGGGTALDGSSLTFGSASFDGMSEYASSAPDDLRLLAGGEAELKAFTLEAQGSFSHLYFNRFFGILSWRGAAYGFDASPRFVHSLAFKAGAVLSALPLSWVPVRVSPHLVAVWKLSALGDDDASDDYYLGFLMSIEW